MFTAIKPLLSGIRKYLFNNCISTSFGGYSHSKGSLIMCVVPNRDYYLFKERILEIDPKAIPNIILSINNVDNIRIIVA